MPQSAFIVRPFGRKPFVAPARILGQMDEILQAQRGDADAQASAIVLDVSGSQNHGELLIDFDEVEKVLIKPALREARIRGDTTGAVVEAGNIREDMFNRLVTADLVVADVSLHNPNVFYELGLRQAFRDKFTFVIRCDLDAYPFDLQTDRYFDYQLIDLVRSPQTVVSRLAIALRKTLNQYRADSPVFKLMPQLEAEDRSRFLSVPDDFREEVERAWHQRQREMLDLLAVECDEEHLWEIEGLRVVGRAQFEANFIEGAKNTWQRIAARYPDDAEANTVLSTVYQRLQDRTRSEQALARVSRSRALSPSRVSELRALTGRNLKAAWKDQWASANLMEERRRVALQSPLLQRAIEAYVDAFKLDLNNSYAGLNALSLQIIQAELIDGQPEIWGALQKTPGDEQREFKQRADRIDQLAQALLLALESDRDRVGTRRQGDPWFAMLEAAVMCTVSSQPEYVAQLYVEARYYAPPKSDASMVGALEMYQQLGIRGVFKTLQPRHLGTLGDNIDAALAALKVTERSESTPQPRRLLVFVGLRVDEGRRPFRQLPPPRHAQDERAVGEGDIVFPASIAPAVRKLIEAEIDKEAESESNLLAMAGGAAGGDLLFHEICRSKGIQAQMFLPLPKPQHIGEYVAPAGGDWVSRFNAIYRQLHRPAHTETPRHAQSGVKVFSDSPDLPRWLQDREHYNVGRRCMLWMLQHASSLARMLEGGAEITLIALHAPATVETQGSFGGIRHAIRLAQMYGVDVRQIEVPRASPNSSREDAPIDTPGTGDDGNGVQDGHRLEDESPRPAAPRSNTSSTGVPTRPSARTRAKSRPPSGKRDGTGRSDAAKD